MIEALCHAPRTGLSTPAASLFVETSHEGPGIELRRLELVL